MIRFSWFPLAFLFFVACSTSHPSPLPPLRGETGALLIQIDALESSSRVDATPSLLQIMRDAKRDLALRARAAGALAVFGESKGIEFCLACMVAGLEGSENRDRRLSIPFSNRMAFPRELVTRSLAKLLQQKGIQPPFFSANFGAPQLRKAEQQWRKLLAPYFKKDSNPNPRLRRKDGEK